MSILDFPLTNVLEQNCSLLPIPDGRVETYWSFWQIGEKNSVNHSKVAHQGNPWGISQEHVAGENGTSCIYNLLLFCRLIKKIRNVNLVILMRNYKLSYVLKKIMKPKVKHIYMWKSLCKNQTHYCQYFLPVYQYSTFLFTGKWLAMYSMINKICLPYFIFKLTCF